MESSVTFGIETDARINDNQSIEINFILII